MEQQLLIHANSEETSLAIKEFVSQFNDATIEEQPLNNEAWYMNTYGISKADFENKLNTGIAQSILGMTRPWNEVQEELLAKISRG